MPDRFTTTTKADSLELDTDPAHIAEPVAVAIKAAVQAGIRALAPRFNRTGHLVAGIRVERQGETYLIAAPGDRLQAEEIMEQLVEATPVIQDPTSAPSVVAAIEASVVRMLTGKR